MLAPICEYVRGCFLPPEILRRADLASLDRDVGRYAGMGDDDLLRATEVCLHNVDRVDDVVRSADADLRIILVPELWERIRLSSGSSVVLASDLRDSLRLITTKLASYQGSSRTQPNRLWSSAERAARLLDSANLLRAEILRVSALSMDGLIDEVRAAVVRSSAADRHSPTDCLYGPGFTYRLVPALAYRALERTLATRSGEMSGS